VRAAIEVEFGLKVRTIITGPVGEESRSYVVDAGGGRYVAKLHDPESAPYLPSTLAVAEWLAERCRRAIVVSSLRTRDGCLYVQLGAEPLTLHPFVDGAPIDRKQVTRSVIERFGAAVAEIHENRPRSLEPDLLVDDFAPGSASAVVNLVERAQQIRADDVVRTEAAELLCRAEKTLRGAATAFEHLSDELAANPMSAVITHGDLTPTNVLVRRGGGFGILDWTAALWAEPERDIRFFTGRSFDAFVAGYRRIRPRYAIRERWIDFYTWRWILDGVAFFGARALAPTTGDARQLAVLRALVAEAVEQTSRARRA
jgi:Ser/Thr protein kinase RdoA (MazF antagonist)